MKILVVVDMQNDFISGSLGTKEAQTIVPKVIAKIKEYEKDCIYFTMDTHDDTYLTTQEGKKLPVPHCMKGTTGWQLCQEIIEIANPERVFEKNTFGSIDLMNQLKKKQPSEVELIGLCTDICVISNAMLLKAALLEAEITVDAACCAGVTVQSHQNALEAMKMCQINVING